MVRTAFALVCAAGLLATPVLARGGGHSSGSHLSSSHSSSSHSYSPRSSGGPGEHYTHAYTTRRGTSVTGHYSTNANGHFGDNYSTKGNINPHTGKEGTRTSAPNGEPR